MAKYQTPRILITRLSHIGDCVLTLPLVWAIRKKYPRAFIAWAVESPTQQLLKLHPGIDAIVDIPNSWLKKPYAWPGLARKLRSYNFDFSIDPQGITKSAGLARISGAKTRVGIRGRWGRELSPRLNNCLVETKSPHLVDRSLELLAPLGIKRPQAELRLPVCTQSLKTILQFLSRNQLSAVSQAHGPAIKAKPFVVINPGASWESKRWELDRFAIVANHLNTVHDMKSVIVWAGYEEKAMAAIIQNRSKKASVMADRTSLTELAALTQQASFFIGGDTGPLHIAAAMGTPCIGLYGTTRPEDSGAYGTQHIALQAWYHSGSCRERRRANNRAMQDISSRAVVDACDTLICRSLSSLSQRNRVG